MAMSHIGPHETKSLYNTSDHYEKMWANNYGPLASHMERKKTYRASQRYN
jgi:hypothetical protein